MLSEVIRDMHGLFITGIDTGVGKTHVTCLLAQRLADEGYSVGVYKPVCSGADPEKNSWPDLELLNEATGRKFSLDWICPQRFRAPLAPPLAAGLEGKSVDRQLLRNGIKIWEGKVDLLLVEGVGGWMCPLTEEETVEDLARDLGFPVLIVAANRLGMVSQTLLTEQSIRFSGLPIVGAVVNPVSGEDDGTRSTNGQILGRFSENPIFGPLSWSPKPSSPEMMELDQLVISCLERGLIPPSTRGASK